MAGEGGEDNKSEVGKLIKRFGGKRSKSVNAKKKAEKEEIQKSVRRSKIIKKRWR